MGISFKTKRNSILHINEGWNFPIRWMRGIRTTHFFVGIMRCETPIKSKFMFKHIVDENTPKEPS